MPEITIVNLGILVTGVVAVLLIARSAKDMTNRALIRSESVLKLTEGLIKRHWAASLVMGLILIGMLFFLKLVGGIADVVLLGIAIVKGRRWVGRHRHRVHYVRSIRPNRKCKSFPVKLGVSGTSQLGSQNVNYMFLDLHNKTITFPESDDRVNSSYYLLDIDFRPKFGPRYERLTYRRPFTIRGHASNDNHLSNIVEIPSTAVVKLISTDASRIIEIKLHNEISDVVDHLKTCYLLNHVERRYFGLD